MFQGQSLKGQATWLAVVVVPLVVCAPCGRAADGARLHQRQRRRTAADRRLFRERGLRGIGRRVRRGSVWRRGARAGALRERLPLRDGYAVRPARRHPRRVALRARIGRVALQHGGGRERVGAGSAPDFLQSRSLDLGRVTASGPQRDGRSLAGTGDGAGHTIGHGGSLRRTDVL